MGYGTRSCGFGGAVSLKSRRKETDDSLDMHAFALCRWPMMAWQQL